MATTLNGTGRAYANSLISAGAIDQESSWSFSAADGNRLLGEDEDWKRYGKCHLGKDTEADAESKAAYKYPFAKFKGDTVTLYRSAIRAIRSRAAQQNESEIFAAAGSIMEKLDAKREDSSFPAEHCRSDPAEPARHQIGESYTYIPLYELRSGGKTLNGADRKEFLTAVAGGDSPDLEIDFRAFQQTEGIANRNHLRFAKKILRGLARSFVGAPLLRDHEQKDMLARAGTIKSSKAVPIDGGLAFDMTASVVAPWAVGALLRGTWDRFSVGWDHGGRDTIECSLCKVPIFTKCSHLPGDKVVTDEESGETHVIEFVFTEATGIEVSGVSVPAVAGTGLTEIRAALSFTAATFAASESREARIMREIALALGLKADATADAILVAIEARSQAVAEISKEVTKLRTQNTELETELTTATARERKRDAEALFTAHAKQLPTERDGDGKRVASALEKKLRELAATDIAAARGILESLPTQTPEQKLESVAVTPPAAQRDVEGIEHLGASIPWNPIIESQLKQLGVTKEQYLQFGPHTRGEN